MEAWRQLAVLDLLQDLDHPGNTCGEFQMTYVGLDRSEVATS